LAQVFGAAASGALYLCDVDRMQNQSKVLSSIDLENVSDVEMNSSMSWPLLTSANFCGPKKEYDLEIANDACKLINFGI
jgi:hypothetical protein